MVKSLAVERFLEKSNEIPMIDVRSPGEFERGHIVGAVNIPLFNNSERAEVGTRYKKVGKESAFLLGLDIVGPKLSGFVKKVKKIAPDGEVLVHCWRGGMRSGSFATLLSAAGMNAYTMTGGYKAYRNYILNYFKQPLNLLVLGGKTGSGKTQILSELEKIGEQVLDLEGLANHKGSSFGMLGQNPQPQTEHFENMLFSKLAILDKSRRIWLEDESRNIGKCNIPEGIWSQMRVSKTLVAEVDREVRVNRLVDEYAQFSKEELEMATNRIGKRLGGQHLKAALEALNQNNFEEAARIALVYYDKTYIHGLDKREKSQVKTIEMPQTSVAEMANILKSTAEQAFINIY